MKPANIFYFFVCLLLISCKEKKTAYQLPFYTTADFTPHWYDHNDTALKNIHTVPEFSFINQDGNTFTSNEVKNKIYVADFFFTRCAGICPKMTTNMNKVAAAFPNDTALMILSHSVTPELDDPATLKTYASTKNIHTGQWQLLTGDKNEIYTIARKGYFAEQKKGFDKDTATFLHTENFVLVDKHGRLRGVYNGTLETEVNDLIEHIKLLKAEKDQ
jgi:protein SCO1/2